MSVKINRLEIENVKRVRAVALEPSAAGLTVIGGRNGQGKTSVLDAIAWALGGEKFRPSEPHREGSVLPPEIHITLSNGITVERKGKSGALKVTDPTGQKSGQQLLNTFVEQLALNLPKFMAASDKEKADTLLQIIGVGDQLAALDQQEKQLYNERTMIGRIADQKQKFAQELPRWDDVPEDLVSPSELIRQQQDILARNGENARKRTNRDRIRFELDNQVKLVARLNEQLAEAERVRAKLKDDLDVAEMDVLALHDESTDELEANIAQIDEINAKIRANLDRGKAMEDAADYANQYTELTNRLEAVRAQRTALLESAELPLPGLTVRDGHLLYNGFPWDGMSGSEQLRVATAIVRKLNPDCGFVLVDKLEQLDPETLHEFGAWIEAEGLQVIATRVGSGGDDYTIIIEDGEAVQEPKVSAWKAGEF